MNPLNVEYCRRQFPALTRRVDGEPAVFFDGPAGSQVPERVIKAVSDYLARTNANHGGYFATSRESDNLLAQAHQAVADLLGTADADEVIFGPNMTSLTFSLSRALAQTWKKGDEVIVSRLDHDANVTPWVLAARDSGATVRHVDICRGDCTLDVDSLKEKLSERTRLVAVGCASNLAGSVSPIKEVVNLAHAVGAEIFLDAVHFAPHRLIDVKDWNADYLVCSAYKFFGPHVGILWGRRERLERLPAYKVRPASDRIPYRWMSGTQNHEGIAGTLAAIDYLADIGRAAAGGEADRRAALRAAFRAIVEVESKLTVHLLGGLASLGQFHVWGITDPKRLHERVPTVSITHVHIPPDEIAQHLATRGIFVWHGNFYALPLTESLGVEPQGMVRIGLLHYNTIEEIDRLLEVLGEGRR